MMFHERDDACVEIFGRSNRASLGTEYRILVHDVTVAFAVILDTTG